MIIDATCGRAKAQLGVCLTRFKAGAPALRYGLGSGVYDVDPEGKLKEAVHWMAWSEKAAAQARTFVEQVDDTEVICNRVKEALRAVKKAKASTEADMAACLKTLRDALESMSAAACASPDRRAALAVGKVVRPLERLSNHAPLVPAAPEPPPQPPQLQPEPQPPRIGGSGSASGAAGGGTPSKGKKYVSFKAYEKQVGSPAPSSLPGADFRMKQLCTWPEPVPGDAVRQGGKEVEDMESLADEVERISQSLADRAENEVTEEQVAAAARALSAAAAEGSAAAAPVPTGGPAAAQAPPLQGFWAKLAQEQEPDAAVAGQGAAMQH
ncbi:hypothetical protein HYH03_014802 [Edaphochlamys debaryana]|uniref:Uncharacterized protein n=1 Tax=Edaphochlamys debaryana TaxID=47281 RepID=A0A835XT94_9CHLO|nr:hypothetical protein HYH03_014802 [Edaphochlamys debaryana]|eukprot:KAG2486500.1 hypothetical protein HYH03_014802 [Edaphochlamys debaryana]